jgi:hypothetical protein
MAFTGCNMFAVTASDIVGTWVIKADTRDFLPAVYKNSAAKIIISANGSFVASDIPGLLHEKPEEIKLDAGTGLWHFDSLEGNRRIQLEFLIKADGKKFEVPYGAQLFFSKVFSTVTLYYYIGDPDEGRRIEFYKVNRG